MAGSAVDAASGHPSHRTTAPGEPGFEGEPRIQESVGLGASHQRGLDRTGPTGALGEESRTDGKTEAGRSKSRFLLKRLKSRLLCLLSVEINKVLSLQICWYDDLNDMTRGRRGGTWTVT